MMLVAILVALIAIGSGQDQCLCPCQNVNTTCQAASITCVNGGAFGAHDCQTTRPCKGPSPVTRCTCPVGYTGVGCDIINPSNSDVCETSRLMYDSSMLNSAAAKYMECTAEITPILQLANLQDHRMNITLDLPNRQAVVALWTRTSKTKGMCGPIIQFFKCTVSDCSLLANTPGTLSTLSCPKKACEICTDPSCPVALQSIIQSFEEKKTPLTILIDPTQRHNINMTVGLDAFVNVKIPVNCMTGSCVSKIDYVPDNAPAIDKSSEMLMMGFWSSLALSMYLVLAVLAVYVNMELNNPPPAIKAMMLDHSHDKPDKHFGKDDGGYERLSTGSPISNSSELSNHPDAILIDDIPDEPLPSSMNPHGTFGLLWKDVGYRMSSRRHGLLCRRRPPKLILSKSTGIVHPGEMVAILGASGAGKSTLLDILGGIDKKGVISGFVDIFGDLNVHRKNVVSYVVQEDYNLSTMTVWETLDFSARMRLSADTSDAEIMARVRAVIEELALVKVATTKVGTLERGGISGGERRRLAIGVELVADPRILLADEPTSGLDSFYADMVIQSLRRRAVRDRCAVLLTIHQPPSHLFPLFHRVVLMCRGGTMAFNGTPDQAIAFFEQETGQTMKPGANPFEFLVEALSNRSTAFNTAIVRHFEESTYCRDMANSVIENIQSKVW
uniref:ABC transporter domain-containing protein n=1 Tax=Spongospora subterranea TaxID=70186 RepID=A0A0H5QHR3_9EUKA|eukprot:CRZ00856.1 hypothetical protein [Spongospora subterranea]